MKWRNYGNDWIVGYEEFEAWPEALRKAAKVAANFQNVEIVETVTRVYKN